MSRATNRPMDSLAEWQVTETGRVQVFLDPERAGSALLNLAVDDLENHAAELLGRGLATGSVETVNKGVKLSTIVDLDGNRITFVGNFREVY